jgi:hypothetical protein
MRKIGISLFTLLAVATSACAESPTASAAGAEAALNGGVADWGSYEEEDEAGFAGAGDGTDAGATEGTVMMTSTETARNPGLGLSGN